MNVGLYIHIPFCRRKCSYCAFYSVANPSAARPESYREALLREYDYFQTHYFESEPVSVQTLYIGGGTPSLFPVSFYQELFESLAVRMDFSDMQEVSMEANPEHLTLDYLRDLYDYTPIRRLSIGVQSFNDADLRFLNRRHSGQEAERAIENARKVGFDNLTVDLMYGLHPERERSFWTDNLHRLQSLQLPHFSAYALTVEPGTALSRKIEIKQTRIADEDVLESEYFQLQEFAWKNGYEAYEISNYARNGAYSRHNCNYWRDVPYIGLGASAHSYIGDERHWNVCDVATYMADPVVGKQAERLREEDRYHEYVMTALRTIWGVEQKKIEMFSPVLQQAFHQCAERQEKAGNLVRRGSAYVVPFSRRLLTDGIAAEFF